MAKFHYELFIDSKTGKRLTDYWHSCISAERNADRYAKRMGGEFYYSDPKYFAGGVSYISFPKNKPADPGVWREVGTQYADGSFVSAMSPNYQGALAEGDVVYFEPNISKKMDRVEIPNQEYRPKDTFDCVHGKEPIERDGKWYLPCLRFLYDEEIGFRHDLKGGHQPRVASRTVRRAIKVELQRLRLPGVKVEPLLNLLGAEWLPKDLSDGKRVKTPDTTPTFFPLDQHYYIGCDYECKADGLRALTPQQYRTAQDKFERQMKRNGN